MFPLAVRNTIVILLAIVNFAQCKSIFGGIKRKESSSRPVFMLQDVSDGSCLSATKFDRCSIETLWTTHGNAGSYTIKRFNDHSLSEDDKELCLVRADCISDYSLLAMSGCDHCGADRWNILGDAESGAGIRIAHAI
jgi:hypothetical protein